MYVWFRHLSVEYQSTVHNLHECQLTYRNFNDMSINTLPTNQVSIARFFSWVDCQWSLSVSTWLVSQLTLRQILVQCTSNGWQHIGQQRSNIGFYLLFAKFKPNMKSFASDISIDIMNVFLVE